MVKFDDIPQMTRDGHYQVQVDWLYLEEHLAGWLHDERMPNMDLQVEPDFQRGHVWDEERQVAYVEHVLAGGRGSNILRFNCSGWMSSFKGPFVLVDGLQRLTAARRFLANEIPAFGHYRDEYEDQHVLGRVNFIVQVNDLKTREQVLRWYLELNTGGVVHTPEEIARVQALLDAEMEG